ncbi:hypothetical protein SLEP1_g36062 [Rubroshorea leprosula]|uniref:Uncharacterized protein n=1 Tax=Rubroshorea leprosula TaxID=152421 RepID=A0AAV5KQF8_9ROSI|nr:hypothetical protein SLEP1_g36062 [Rubroshorea leprosula]
MGLAGCHNPVVGSEMLELSGCLTDKSAASLVAIAFNGEGSCIWLTVDASEGFELPIGGVIIPLEERQQLIKAVTGGIEEADSLSRALLQRFLHMAPQCYPRQHFPFVLFPAGVVSFLPEFQHFPGGVACHREWTQSASSGSNLELLYVGHIVVWVVK